jgi:hypothetical protein
VTELAGAIEGAVIATIAEKSGLKVLQRRSIVAGMPITIHRAIRGDDGAFTIIDSQFTVPIRTVTLDEDVSEPGGSVFWGCPTGNDHKPIVQPIAWPD